MKALVAKIGWLFYILAVLALLEAACVFVWYFNSGRLLYNEDASFNQTLFEPHVYLGVALKKNVQLKYKGLTFTHSKNGFRGSSSGQAKQRFRILAIGGSTTYGIGVSDDQTWPVQLQKVLNDQVEVFNMGVPGYSTVENIIQTEFLVPDLAPDLIILHVGLNDMQSMHSAGLVGDYSNYHGPRTFANLGQCYLTQLPRVGIIRMAAVLLQQFNLFPRCHFHRQKLGGVQSGEIDSTALEIYRRNIETLLNLSRQFHASVVFAPQLLLNEKVADGSYAWWIPFIPKEKLIEVLAAYNETARQVATEHGALFVESILSHEWRAEDFLDTSHLNAVANKIFAALVAEAISPLLANKVSQPAIKTD